MSFTKKFLEESGIDAEKINLIMKEHEKEINALKAKSDSYKTESDSFRTQLEELKKAVSEKEIAEKKDNAIRKELQKANYSETGINRIIKSGGYRDKIELDENENMKNPEAFMTDVKSEWSEYKPSETVNYPTPSTPPENTVSSDSKHEIAQYAEEYYNKLYGTKKEE